MNIVLLAFMDTAAQSSTLWKGLRDYSDHNVRLITFSRTFLAYEEDIYYPEMKKESWAAISQADLFHISDGVPLVEGYDLENKLLDTPFVQEFHGTYAWMNWKHLLAQWLRARNNLVYVTHLSTRNVRERIGFSVYVPRSIDFRDIPPQNRDPKRIRVAHCPTERSIKSTDFFFETMGEIEKEYPNVETVLVEKKSWEECLKIKATCDLVFDHLGAVEQGYGLNSIEAMALNIPTLCSVGYYTYVYHPDCPVVNVSQNTLKSEIIKLIENDDLRRKLGQRGFEYVKRVHDIRTNVKRWESLFSYIINKMK